MENQMFNISSPDMASRNSLVMDGISPHSTMNSLVQSYSFDHSSDLHVTNQAENIVSPNAFYTYKRNVARDASLGSSSAAANCEFQETPESAVTIAAYVAAKGGLQENLNNLAISVMPQMYSAEVLADFVQNNCSNTSNSRFPTSMNGGNDEVLGIINSQWDIQKYPASLELVGKSSSEFHPYSSTGNLAPNGWISPDSASLTTVHSYGSSKFSNELSLTLATSQPSAITGMNIPGQCSDMSCSAVAHNSSNETMLGSDQTSCNSEELSLSFGSYRPPQFSQVILGSQYLCAVQEILAQIASFSLENVDHANYLNASLAINTPFSSNCSAQREISLMDPSDGGSRPEGGEVDPALHRRAIETKKAKLLALLQMVDDRYNQCLDEIHTVISAFHAATELDPQIHARFALQTISILYKSLRERISNQCLAMGSSFDPSCSGDTERSFETSFIQKQWALQQLKKKEHQLWRPQRGLPERSVSVLRAWMFQNFLHPYPKDAEKQLLAVKSGLTRNQVSNWFINARVRLWKPMIEEMYAEMNRRKSRRNENMTESNNQRSRTSTSNNQRYNVN
ncbi:Homeobox protein ATH1 [Morus notabilis]|uniref:Homeobox protein ATH1 n=2 Tax=Morus notabilis TaxID=981085 RepID=W9RE35_9ROSA|nr:Homeobox protein ATH1 [Morus notabilis]